MWKCQVRGCERFWSYWYPLLNSFEKWQYQFHPHQGLAVSISQSPHQPLHPSQWVWEEKPPVRPMEWGPRGLGKVETVWRCKGNSPEGGSQFPGRWSSEHFLPSVNGKGDPSLSSRDSAQDLGTVCAQMLGEVGISKFQVVSETPEVPPKQASPMRNPSAGGWWEQGLLRRERNFLSSQPVTYSSFWGTRNAQLGHPSPTPCLISDHVPAKEICVFCEAELSPRQPRIGIHWIPSFRGFIRYSSILHRPWHTVLAPSAATVLAQCHPPGQGKKSTPSPAATLQSPILIHLGFIFVLPHLQLCDLVYLWEALEQKNCNKSLLTHPKSKGFQPGNLLRGKN